MKDKLLGGRYQVVEILSSGGFSQTYVALDTHRPGNPKCVVKHLKPTTSNLSSLQNARRLFQSEAETLEKLGDHERIPRLLAYFEENQEFYLVQDFIQGHLLKAELQPGQSWSETKVCQLLEEVLNILVFVHSQGVIHRDIKPSNLIRRQQDNRLVLVDFGSVKQAWTQVVTARGKTCTTFAIGIPATIAIGTPGYMAIEQERGRPRPNSDIYALGMIGIQALTGLNFTEILEDSDTGDIIWQHQAHVSDALASVLTKMVRYHFKDRYQTAAEALQALQLVNLQPPVEGALGAEGAGGAGGAGGAEGTLGAEEEQNVRTDSLCFQFSSTSPASSIPLLSSLPNLFYSPSSPTSLTSPSSPTSLTSLTSPCSPSSKSSPSPKSYLKTDKHRLLTWARIATVLISVVVGYVIYSQVRPSIEKTLEEIETLIAAGKYEECVNQATAVPQDSRFYTYAQALLHECQLAQATELAAEGNFKAAITEAGKIPQDAAYHQDAQQLIDQWSDSILQIAMNQYHSGKLNDAIAIAKAIPETSPVYQKAQGGIKQWNREWEKNNSYLTAANSALDEGKWQNAISEAKKVIDTPYWQERIKPIIQKAELKIAESKTAVTNQSTRTTPRRLTRASSSPPTRTTPRRLTRASRPPTRTTPRRLTRASRPPTRTTPRRLTRSAPPKPSYTWTTETVP